MENPISDVEGSTTVWLADAHPYAAFFDDFVPPEQQALVVHVAPKQQHPCA